MVDENESKGRILIVDDDRTIRFTVMRMLDHEGFEACEVSNAAGVLEAVKTFSPHLIMLDVMLGDKSGFDVCRDLKDDSELADIPVIFISGYDRIDERIEGLSLGALDFLQKPIDFRIMLRKAETFVALRRGQLAAEEMRETLLRRTDQLEIMSRAVEQNPCGIVITDPNGTIQYVNPKFTVMTGYESEEVIGQITSISKSGNTPRELYDDLWSTVLDGREWHGVFQNRRKDGSLYWESALIAPVRSAVGKIAHFVAIKLDITAQRDIERELQLIRAAVSSSNDAILITDSEGTPTFVNGAWEKLSGWNIQDCIGFNISNTFKEGTGIQQILSVPADLPSWEGKMHVIAKNGEEIPVTVRASALVAGEMDQRGICIVCWDQRERIRAEEEKHAMEINLRHAQKMESVGQLAAGIAHEINTPVQFVGDNIEFLRDAINDLMGVIETYQEVINDTDKVTVSDELKEKIEEKLDEADLGYLKDEVPMAISQSLDGVKRISKIVRAMKEFSHPDSSDVADADLNSAIETTVTVARNEWKYVADMVMELASDLPQVPCQIGEFNQCILNMIVNASHAIADQREAIGTEDKGKITIRTTLLKGEVEIQVSDTGAGIPERAQAKVFDPFFTTKEVGKGTGQGLAITHNVIVQKHGGNLRFETAPGQGTTFFITLPLKREDVFKTCLDVDIPKSSS